MAESAHTTLRALQFNVWLDATKVRDGLRLAADAILDSEADIVSLVEVKNLRGDFVERLKKKLKEQGGLTYYGRFAGNALKFGLDADAAIISRYPVTEETIVYRTRENCIVRSIIDLGEDRGTVAVYSVHLEYRYYSCYLPRGYSSHSEQFPGWGRIGRLRCYDDWLFSVGGWFRTLFFGTTQHVDPALLQPVTDPELIRRDNLASTRSEAILRLIKDARSLEQQNVPIIVMGDFNEPSTLDWTEETANLAGHNGLVYKWDTTECLKEHGYIDTYRALYPSPAKFPGFTWPAAAQGEGETPKKTDWIKGADERDRIDYIFCKGTSIRPMDAWLVGTPLSLVEDEFVDESKVFRDKFSYSVGHPWPSDHRAIMTVFEQDKIRY